MSASTEMTRCSLCCWCRCFQLLALEFFSSRRSNEAVVRTDRSWNWQHDVQRSLYSATTQDNTKVDDDAACACCGHMLKSICRNDTVLLSSSSAVEPTAPTTRCNRSSQEQTPTDLPSRLHATPASARTAMFVRQPSTSIGSAIIHAPVRLQPQRLASRPALHFRLRLAKQAPQQSSSFLPSAPPLTPTSVGPASA